MSVFVGECATELYEDTVDQLRELAAREGYDMPTRAYAEAVADPFREMGHEVWGKPSGSNSIRGLLGKKPLPPFPRPGVDDGKMPNEPPANDHGWLHVSDKKGPRYISQPYDLTFDDLKEIVKFCEKWGLKVCDAAGHSWHFPGQTLFLLYSRDN